MLKYNGTQLRTAKIATEFGTMTINGETGEVTGLPKDKEVEFKHLAGFEYTEDKKEEPKKEVAPKAPSKPASKTATKAPTKK